MRHSDPRLTSIIYTDASQLPTVDAVRNLPSFLNPQPAAAAKSSDLPSDLRPLADNWESLPQSVRDALLAIAQAAKK